MDALAPQALVTYRLNAFYKRVALKDTETPTNYFSMYVTGINTIDCIAVFL